MIKKYSGTTPITEDLNPYQSPEATPEQVRQYSAIWLVMAAIAAYPAGMSFHGAFIKYRLDWTAPYDCGWFLLFSVLTVGYLYAFITDKGD